jgi:hypothetical protein
MQGRQTASHRAFLFRPFLCACASRSAPLRGWRTASWALPRSEALTRAMRVLASRSSGFPGENFFEPNAGAAGRHHPSFRSHTCFGGSSLKEIVLSSRFSCFFFLVCPSQGRTFYVEAVGFFLSVFVMIRVPFFHARATNSSADCSRSFHRVRSQSFLSSRLHPNSSLRVSAHLTVSAQAAWSQDA